MKSSIATASMVAESANPSPRSVLPLVIRTRVICSGLKITPRKDKEPTRAFCLRREVPLKSKNSMEVLFAMSTSVKTTPNPLRPAGTLPPVPGIEKVPSVMLLPIGAKRRTGLKVLNSVP